MKKIIILVIVFAFAFLIGVSYFSHGGSQQSAGQGLTAEQSSSAAPPAVSHQPLTEEEIREEIEDLNNEETSPEDSSQQVPTVSVSEEFVIELEENQGTGGL